MPSSRGSSQPGIAPRSPTLQVGSLLFEPPGKPFPSLERQKEMSSNKICTLHVFNNYPSDLTLLVRMLLTSCSLTRSWYTLTLYSPFLSALPSLIVIYKLNTLLKRCTVSVE